jgi:hypothetical protein
MLAEELLDGCGSALFQIVAINVAMNSRFIGRDFVR